ncbi:MAG: carbamoyltransferase HypF [Acidobacteriota bacterium]
MQRRRLVLEGIVQGVGFRPFVHGLAREMGVSGFVKNGARGLLVEVQGASVAVDDFVARLRLERPPLARVESIVVSDAPADSEDRSFRIAASEDGGDRGVSIAPDAATCDACLRELEDPEDRRHGYAFISCAGCGPRFTIARGAPFDRARTTMAPFEMCGACRDEYEDPRDRRFHAQTIACGACGPTLFAADAAGRRIGGDPIAAAVSMLREGAVVAVKGLGGFHLACDASSESALKALRLGKARAAKPFAVMVRDMSEAEGLCALSADERDLLSSPARPIVLLDPRPGAPVACGVANGAPSLGVMLPYTPVHHLLLARAARPLVMTSGNRSDEPIACDDLDALDRLGRIAGLFLLHDRAIAARCDDSVARVAMGPTLLRRSRGSCPAGLPLPVVCAEPVLAAGGALRSAFALGEGRRALPGPHVGTIDGPLALAAFGDAVAAHERLSGLHPRVLAHDLHPDDPCAAWARSRAELEGGRAIAVQHHHAHVASCMAENGLDEPCIGVAFDGTGYGPDGTVWGGEFLVGGLASVRRAAHLGTVAMPGGDAAVREPWRMALSHLVAAGLPDAPIPCVDPDARRIVARMIERRVNAPGTSSAGRLFDAVAALAGVRARVAYEAQAAIELEGLGASVTDDAVYDFELAAGDPIVADVGPLVRSLVADLPRAGAARAARRFHNTIAAIVGAVCARLRETTGIDAVALSGGVFGNRLLLEGASATLSLGGFRVFRHRLVPPGDGGLALGQLAVAAAGGAR